MTVPQSIDQQLRQALYQAWLALGGEKKALKPETIHLEHPGEASHGDYASNIALVLFSTLKSKKTLTKWNNPGQLAEALAGELEKQTLAWIEKIEVARGFVNLWLKQEWLVKEAGRALTERDAYGKNGDLTGKKIMLEFGQPNTHKMPHIGHLFSYVLGESLVRILEANGATLFRANYQGDIGLHVAKCLWGVQQGPERIKRLKTLKEKVGFLQKAYQEGAKAYEESESAKEEILRINKSLYENDDQQLMRLWQETREWSVEFYKQFEAELDVHYDRSYFESEMYEKGMQIVQQAIGKVFTKSQGAVIFPGSKYGLHDRVFITQWDTPTYEAKDMALQATKYKEWPFDLAVITTASEQNEYFKVVFKALEELDSKYIGKLKHIGFGMVSLKGMKMSSRTGKIVSAPFLVEYTIQEAENLAMEKGISETDKVKITIRRDRAAGLSERKMISKQVGLGAIKYSFLKSRVGQDIVFNFGESISLEGDSGPYLQYTFARAQSVLKKAREQGVEPAADFGSLSTDFNQEERAILRWLYRFPEVVREAGEAYAPNLVANFLYELAQRYNAFYNKHRILSAKTTEQKKMRVGLTAATGQVLANGLTLLGISTPQKM